MSLILGIIGTGIGMGFVHVLTGPDHLSALATLSANVGNGKAFWLGVRWGIGHSTGLVVVAIILLATADGGQIEFSSKTSLILESIVGLFMLLLGTWGAFTAITKDRTNNELLFTNNAKLEEEHDLELSSTPPEEENKETTTTTTTVTKIHQGEGSLSIHDISNSTNNNNNKVDRNETTTETVAIPSTNPSTTTTKVKTYISRFFFKPKHSGIEEQHDTTSSSNDQQESCGLMGFFVHSHDHHHHVHDENTNNHNNDANTNTTTTTTTTGIMALGIGIVHGIAGPGGILGVLPAVQLNNWTLSLTYLISFCITSILVMGTFSALYGTVTHDQHIISKKHMELFSSGLSIFVGFIWLSLLYTGNLEFLP